MHTHLHARTHVHISSSSGDLDHDIGWMLLRLSGYKSLFGCQLESSCYSWRHQRLCLLIQITHLNIDGGRIHQTFLVTGLGYRGVCRWLTSGSFFLLVCSLTSIHPPSSSASIRSSSPSSWWTLPWRSSWGSPDNKSNNSTQIVTSIGQCNH